MRRNAACLAWLAAAAALAACSSKTPDVEPNVAPTNYKQEIVNTLKETLDDPNNIRDAFISDPVLTSTGVNQRYTACVRFNARDASRRYIGSTDRIAYFYGGHHNQLVEASTQQCGNASYKPFPELEKICRGEKCR